MSRLVSLKLRLDAPLEHRAGELVDEAVGERDQHVHDHRLTWMGKRPLPGCQLVPSHLRAKVQAGHLRPRVEDREATLVGRGGSAARRDVDYHVRALLAHHPQDLAVDLRVVGAVGEVVRIAPVDVHDRRSGLVGLARLQRDLPRLLRQRRMTLLTLDAAVDGAGDDQRRELARALHPLVGIGGVPHRVLHAIRPPSARPPVCVAGSASTVYTLDTSGSSGMIAPN